MESRPSPGKSEKLFDGPSVPFTMVHTETEQTAIEKKVKGGGYERRRVRNSDLPHKCVTHDAPFLPFRPEMSLCNAMVTPCCVCGSWCHYGLGSQKRNQHLTGESGNETNCVYTCWHCVSFTRYTIILQIQRTADFPNIHERSPTFCKNVFLLAKLYRGYKTMTLLF